MTNETEDTSTKTRRIFYVSVVFDQPVEATVTVAAWDPDHAKELVQSQFGDRKNLKITDVFDAIAIEKSAREMDEIMDPALKTSGVIDYEKAEDAEVIEQPSKKVILN